MTAGVPRTIALLFAILVAAALLNGLALPLAGRNARPEHIVAPIVLATFVVWQWIHRATAIRVDAFSTLAVAWVAVNALSSWLYAPQPSESFVHVVRLALLAAIFLTVANLPFRDAAQWTHGFRLWLTLGVVELAYGLAAWALAQYGNVWVFGTFYERAIAGISVGGTQLERNFFGIFAGTLLVVVTYSLLAQRQFERHVIARTDMLMAACALAGATVVVALTRSAWIAVVAVGPAAYLLLDRRRRGKVDRPLVHTMILLPILLGAFVGLLWTLPTTSASNSAPAETKAAPPAPGNIVVDRLSSLRRLESDFTTNTRLQDARWAVDDWLASPFLGHGTGSFVQIHGIRVGTEAWISNLILHTMVDTGLVGLTIQMVLFVLVADRTWRAARAATSLQLAVGLKALTLGLLVMVVAYQLTDGTWLAVFWVHLGLMVNGVYAVDDARQGLVAEPAFPKP